MGAASVPQVPRAHRGGPAFRRKQRGPPSPVHAPPADVTEIRAGSTHPRAQPQATSASISTLPWSSPAGVASRAARIARDMITRTLGRVRQSEIPLPARASRRRGWCTSRARFPFIDSRSAPLRRGGSARTGQSEEEGRWKRSSGRAREKNVRPPRTRSPRVDARWISWRSGYLVGGRVSNPIKILALELRPPTEPRRPLVDPTAPTSKEAPPASSSQMFLLPTRRRPPHHYPHRGRCHEQLALAPSRCGSAVPGSLVRSSSAPSQDSASARPRKLFFTDVLFAGAMIGPNGLKPNLDKVGAVANWPVPENVADPRQSSATGSQLYRFDVYHPQPRI
ncbi:hypothetical protein B0H11DRAFT_2247321 [Mycena galericulata]|nr:hypothetical protein B0H11DRAFT_2247321 [Mycena galericulata]